VIRDQEMHQATTRVNIVLLGFDVADIHGRAGRCRWHHLHDPHGSDLALCALADCPGLFPLEQARTHRLSSTAAIVASAIRLALGETLALLLFDFRLDMSVPIGFSHVFAAVLPLRT
jgi:hypothetical protein